MWTILYPVTADNITGHEPVEACGVAYRKKDFQDRIALKDFLVENDLVSEDDAIIYPPIVADSSCNPPNILA